MPADLNGDKIVNFRDFALLAAGWLTTYDINNLNTITDKWLQLEPNIQIQIYGDGNNGFVEVGANGYFSDTQRIFLLADGQYVGEIFGFRNGYPLGIDVSKLGPGTHQLKAISVDAFEGVTCSNLTENTFNCFINYCFCPKFYEPNKPLHFYGFSSVGDISVKAFEYGEENSLWSKVYSGENLSGFIPAEVTVLDNIDYVVFEEGSSGQMMALSGSGSSGAAAKPVESLSEPNNIRALLILPNHLVNELNGPVIEAVKETFKSRNIPYKSLGCWGSSAENIAKYADANKYNINYIYYTGDGNYIYIDASGNDSYRTYVEIDDGYLYSFKPSCVRGGFDLYNMGFKNITFAFFDCCYTGRLVCDDDNLVEDDPGYPPDTEKKHNDMSKALRMDIGGSHFFQGWYGDKPAGMINYKKLGKNVKNPYNYFSLYEFGKLKEGDNLQHALEWAIQEVMKTSNGVLYGEDAMNDLRIRGQGNMWEVKIE
jgi:hypothetical protein